MSFFQAQKFGIKFVTVGIEDSNNLNQLASAPKNLYSFYTKRYLNLLDYGDRVVRRICQGKTVLFCLNVGYKIRLNLNIFDFFIRIVYISYMMALARVASVQIYETDALRNRCLFFRPTPRAVPKFYLRLRNKEAFGYCQTRYYHCLLSLYHNHNFFK